MTDMATPQNGTINRDSAISVGLAILLLGGAVAVWVAISSVRDELVPRLAVLEANMGNVRATTDRIEAAVSRYSTDAGTLRVDFESLRAQLRELAELRKHVDALEARVKALEK